MLYLNVTVVRDDICGIQAHVHGNVFYDSSMRIGPKWTDILRRRQGIVWSEQDTASVVYFVLEISVAALYKYLNVQGRLVITFVV